MHLKPGSKVIPFKDSHSFKFMNRAIDKLGMKYTLHQLRETFATIFVNNGLSIYDA